MTIEEREIIRAAYGGGRASSQRLLLAAAAQKMAGAFTVDELAAEARRHDPGLGIATAYRAVAAMMAADFLEHVGERHGRALYVRCAADGHHHHLVCTDCGSVSETPCPIAGEALGTANENGFVVTRHDLTLYGLCRACAARDARRPRGS